MALAEAIEAHGGTIRLQVPMEKLDLTEDGRLIVHVAQENPHVYDRTVVTTPIFALRKAMADGQLASVAEKIDAGIDMQGVVNAVFTLRRGLTKHYWVATIDEEIPFQGIVESTTLLEKTDTAGVHLVYLMNYVHRTDLRFHQSDAEILDAYMIGLKRLFPDLVDEDVIDRFVFRSPFVEPIYTTGYQQRKPPTTLLPGKLYLATTTLVYPVVTVWVAGAGSSHNVMYNVPSLT